MPIADRWLEMPGAKSLNLWTGSRIQKPEVLSKVPEMVRTVVNFTNSGNNARKKIIVVTPEVAGMQSVSFDHSVTVRLADNYDRTSPNGDRTC